MFGIKLEHIRERSGQHIQNNGTAKTVNHHRYSELVSSHHSKTTPCKQNALILLYLCSCEFLILYFTSVPSLCCKFDVYCYFILSSTLPLLAAVRGSGVNSANTNSSSSSTPDSLVKSLTTSATDSKGINKS